MSDYINLLIHNFGVNLLVTLVILLMISGAVLFMISMSIKLIFDYVYKPVNVPFKYNLLFDHLTPLIILISPYCILQINTTNIVIIGKISYIILMHVFIIVPLLYFWLNNRNWFHEQERGIFKDILGWNDPQIYFYISKAIIYPMIYIFYFSFIRYFRLGTNLDIYQVFFLITQDNVILFFLIILALPNIFVWCVVFWNIIANVKNNIWMSCVFVMSSIHFALLKYIFYFKLIEKVYKLHFIFFNLVSLNATLLRYTNHENYDHLNHNKRYSYVRQIIHHLYHRPVIIYILMFFVIFIEIIFFKKMYISYYLLFIIPLMMMIFKGFNYYGLSDFTIDVCKVDYLNKNIKKPRYPALFWRLMENPELFFGFLLNLSEDEYKEWNEEYLKYTKENQIYQPQRVEKLFNRITKKNTTKPWCMQIKILYYKLNQVRWNNNV